MEHLQLPTSMLADTVPSYKDNAYSAMESLSPPRVNLVDSVSKKSDSKRGSLKGKQDSDKPKRPLSAYNLFFQHNRAEILKKMPSKYEGGKPRRSHGKIGFASLARTVAANWNNIDPETRQHFDELAAKDKERYRKEMEAWKAKESTKKSNEPLPLSAASKYMGGMPYAGFNAHSIVKCNLMAQSSQNYGSRMPLNKFRALSQPLMGNAQRLMPPNFFSNNQGGMHGGSASQVVGQALALLEEEMPSFQKTNNFPVMCSSRFEDEPENAFANNPDICDLASQLDDDCLGLLSGLL